MSAALIEVIGPAVGEAAVVLGRIAGFTVAGNNLKPHKSPDELERELMKLSKVKTKTKVKRPGTKVLRFDDAIECIEEVCEKQYAASFAKAAYSLVKSQFGSDPESGANILAQAIIDCLEKKLLGQTKPKHLTAPSFRRRGTPETR